MECHVDFAVLYRYPMNEWSVVTELETKRY